MARVPYHNLKDFDGERIAAFYQAPENAALANANICRMLPHVGDAGLDFIQMSATLRFGGQLDRALREMAIVRIGARAQSKYELYYHELMLKELGADDEKIRAIHEGPAAQNLTELERHVLLFTDAIVDRFKPDDADFNFLLETLGMRQLHELVFNIGFYLMSCAYMETFELEIEQQPVPIKV